MFHTVKKRSPTVKRRILVLRLVLPPLRHHIQDGVEVEVHAFVDGRVGDLPSFLEEVTPLAQLVHFDAHLRRKRR